MSGRGPLARPRHLARRFVGSLSHDRPPEPEEQWAAALLGHSERRLWARMAPADQRHAIWVAHRVEGMLPPGGRDSSKAVLAAALLHDVGKVESGLGTPGRVIATVLGSFGGGRLAARWQSSGGWRGRLGRYWLHASIGAGLLSDAGSDPLVVRWASEHHLPPERWELPAATAVVLKSADDD